MMKRQNHRDGAAGGEPTGEAGSVFCVKRGATERHRFLSKLFHLKFSEIAQAFPRIFFLQKMDSK